MMRQTSIDAYKSIEPELNKRCNEVFQAIKSLENPTNSEIASHLGIPINQVTGRTNELVHKYGLVTEWGKKLCSITNRNVLAWMVKENDGRN